jgi:hypothetical protein
MTHFSAAHYISCRDAWVRLVLNHRFSNASYPSALAVSSAGKSPSTKSRVFEANQGHKNRIITCIHGRYALPYGHCGNTLPALRRMPSLSYMHSTRWAMLRDCCITTRLSSFASVRVKDEKLVHIPPQSSHFVHSLALLITGSKVSQKASLPCYFW